MNKPKHGGARKGAGRKRRTTPLTALTVRMEQSTKEKLAAICRATGRTQAGQVTNWIENEAAKANR